MVLYIRMASCPWVRATEEREYKQAFATILLLTLSVDYVERFILWKCTKLCCYNICASIIMFT